MPQLPSAFQYPFPAASEDDKYHQSVAVPPVGNRYSGALAGRRKHQVLDRRGGLFHQVGGSAGRTNHHRKAYMPIRLEANRL